MSIVVCPVPYVLTSRYLDSVIHFAYVLLRMLERYSKSKSYMFIRKRKAAKKKRKAEDENGSAPLPEEYGEDEEAGILDGDDDTPSYAEHAFTFQAFEKVSACWTHWRRELKVSVSPRNRSSTRWYLTWAGSRSLMTLSRSNEWSDSCTDRLSRHKLKVFTSR